MGGSGALRGRRILVTRPLAQSAGLAALLRGAGGEPVCVPAIEIRDIEDLASAHAVADRLEEFRLAIFVSANAVRRGLAIVRARRGPRAWPAGLRVATVGQGSREALVAEGFADAIAPRGRADSEALLALPELADVGGSRIAIFRGDGGRAQLGEELERRGASVAYAACYRRVRPDPAAARAAWAAGADAIAVSSAEGLANLLEMLGEEARGRLAETPVFVPHARVAADAERRGLRRVRVAGPRDAEMAAAVVAYFDGAG